MPAAHPPPNQRRIETHASLLSAFGYLPPVLWFLFLPRLYFDRCSIVSSPTVEIAHVSKPLKPALNYSIYRPLPYQLFFRLYLFVLSSGGQVREKSRQLSNRVDLFLSLHSSIFVWFRMPEQVTSSLPSSSERSSSSAPQMEVKEGKLRVSLHFQF
jgi:hypothetical protein